MAHFAELDENNIVKRVIVVNNADCLKDGIEDETTGIAFCQKLFGGNWIQTSYNGKVRKNYAGIGYTYDETKDAFIPPKPYESWALNEVTCRWEAPIPHPEKGMYEWDEEEQAWVEVE